MKLWDFIVEHILPLFGEIPAADLEVVKRIFWITLGSCIVYSLVYLPFKGVLVLLKKTKWKERWLF